MKRVFVFILAAFLVLSFAGIGLADDVTKTLTFEWTMEDTTNLKEWQLLWSDTAGGPYDIDPASVIAYDSALPGPTYASPEAIDVFGNQATHVIKYFVLVACGDIPQPDGTTKFICSDYSNEVNHDFWIPAGQFSVPVQFIIKTVSP